jgi:hypothetical protein
MPSFGKYGHKPLKGGVQRKRFVLTESGTIKGSEHIQLTLDPCEGPLLSAFLVIFLKGTVPPLNRPKRVVPMSRPIGRPSTAGIARIVPI